MAPTLIFSSSPPAVSMGGLIPTFKFPNSARMIRSITPVSVFQIPSPSLVLPPPFEGGNNMFSNLAPNKATLKKTPSSPCLMLPPTFDDGSDDMCYNMYNLAQNKVLRFNNKKLMPEEDTKIVGSSHGWLSLFNERNCDLTLINPVTCSHVKLPPSNSDTARYTKVIHSCDAEQEECQAMMIDGGRKLAFCYPGRSPTEWTPLGALMRRPPRNDIPRSYEDLVYSRRHNLFFCVTATYNGDDFEAWDLSSYPPRLRWENRDDLMDHYGSWLSQTAWLFMEKTGMNCAHHTYLVFAEETDQLFFVTRHVLLQWDQDNDDIYPYKTILFDVHKLDWEFGGDGGRLSHLDGGSLDGLAMFVGANHSFAVLPSDANGLKPNSIYFTDEKTLHSAKYLGGHDIGIFDYKNKTISYYFPSNLEKNSIWFTPLQGSLIQ
ncbi:hypothetical protein CASFOL_036991 [Castilleja foliolosa]|uniref:KIB1-4 beta-propeller domain-containing protein n=1 Tax=Castilleja foliolosa TaxID=1961234 RepID=A0ABD3BQZ8_9LAMI